MNLGGISFPDYKAFHKSIVIKNEIFLFLTTWRELDGNELNQRNYKEKDKYWVISDVTYREAEYGLEI